METINTVSIFAELVSSMKFVREMETWVKN